MRDKIIGFIRKFGFIHKRNSLERWIPLRLQALLAFIVGLLIARVILNKEDITLVFPLLAGMLLGAVLMYFYTALVELIEEARKGGQYEKI